MISRMKLQHFKCFESINLEMRACTLLSGGNASGKSSILQALALLHQTIEESRWSSNLVLNGRVLRLGTGAEIIDQVNGRRSCRIELHEGDESWIAWEFGVPEDEYRDGLTLELVKSWGYTEEDGEWEDSEVNAFRFLFSVLRKTHPIAERLEQLVYLSAERLGPREFYELGHSSREQLVGPSGEFAVSVLYTHGEQPVLVDLVDKKVPPTLSRQAEAWLSNFFPGYQMIVDRVPRANAVTLGIRESSGTNFLRPVHTGFAITQVLPIIVAGLSARKNDILLIENPEVHLHPAGQAMMGRFLARLASAGIQVVVETHSDHILNGIRRSVKLGRLDCDDLAIYFFRPRSANGNGSFPQVEMPQMDEHGNIDYWPDGFFDQFDHDMNFLAGWE